VADNPYRFTVKAEEDFDGWHIYIDWFINGEFMDCACIPNVDLPTEAEANEHADMILTALQGATRE